MLARALKALRNGNLFRADASLDAAFQAFQKGNLHDAERLLEQLWQEQPHAAVAALQGQVLRASGRWPEAIAWFEKALVNDPSDARPAIAIGQLQRQLGDHEAARASFQRVVQQAGEQQKPLGLLTQGLAHAELGQADAAIAVLEQAIATDPCLIEAHQACATVLEQQGQLGAALRHQEALAALQPSALRHPLQQALTLLQLGEADESLRRMEPLLPHAGELAEIGEAFQFMTSTAGPGWLEPRRTQAALHWHRHATARPAALAPTSPGAALRVGILTAELGSHPVSQFLEGLLRHHNRQRLQLELIETQPRWENRNQELRQLAHDTLLLPQADATVRRDLIRSRHYDVILETSGFTTASGLPLLAERLAPVQCHYVGFHASTLLPSIDWFIADPALLPPELDDQFSERIWRLPRPWAACTPPGELPPLPLHPLSGPPVFGSCNQIAKIGSETLRFWAAALRAVPDAQLLVKHRFATDPRVRRRLTEVLSRSGVAADRLHLEGWAADWSTHMETYNRIDIALDATPWSSATTAFEALAMGTPLVAIRGGTLAGRMSSAALAGYGEPGWIADTPESFAAIVSGLVADLPSLRRDRDQRRRRALASPLFDGADLAAALGDALGAMVEAQRQDGPRP